MAVGGFRYRSVRLAGSAAIAVAALAAGGCVIVVDGRDDPDYSAWRDSKRNYIGVTIDQVSRETASQLALDRDLVTLVTFVYSSTPAERAGLARYDIITTIDGQSPASPSRVRAAVRAKQPGEEIHLGVVRGGKPMDVTVVIGQD